MDINDTNLEMAFKGFQTRFNTAFEGAPNHRERIAVEIPSVARDETYGWLGNFPRIREWLGDRIINRLGSHGFTIKNKLFESTVAINRSDFEDDRFGMYGSFFDEMGRLTKQHPDELVFELLAIGFAENCYDGQPFFDADHPVKDVNGNEQSVSNMQAGAETPWFLMDSSRALKPLVWQTRTPYQFQRVEDDRDAHVFLRDEYLYGVRARANAGFGLWQLAFGSKAALDATNYAAARAAMMAFRGDNGRILGIMPDTLVVPPSLEQAGREIVASVNNAAGASNPWNGTAELVVAPYLAG